MIKVKILQPVLHDVLGALETDLEVEVHETVAEIWVSGGACEYVTKVLQEKPIQNKAHNKSIK
jgi:hypothetical protein